MRLDSKSWCLFLLLVFLFVCLSEKTRQLKGSGWTRSVSIRFTGNSIGFFICKLFGQCYFCWIHGWFVRFQPVGEKGNDGKVEKDPI